MVTSLAEVWIEILLCHDWGFKFWSLPLRKCGLKLAHTNYHMYCIGVTSLAEVWIEIRTLLQSAKDCFVTSLAEVWIEMFFESIDRVLV